MTNLKITMSRMLLSLLLLGLGGTPVFCQADTLLELSGEVATPLKLTMKELLLFPQVSRVVKDRDGKSYEFSGVPVVRLLEKAGAVTGGKLRGEYLTRYLLVTAADGYEVVYALPELDPEFTDHTVFVALKKEGRPLPHGEGPFRMIAPQDKRQARWVKEVRKLTLAYAAP